jgi:hypothetical protein
MKSIAHQSVAELGGQWSVLTRQKNDHVKLDRLLNRLTVCVPQEQSSLLPQIYRLVFPHAFAEEAILWPVIRRVLVDGQELTLRVELEHQQINELVSRLETLPISSPSRQEMLAQMIHLLRTDVRDEEDELLARLQTKLTRGQLWLLGIAWEAVRLVAPTRAHPIVSRRPPGNVLSALPLAILDRCRDSTDSLVHRGAGGATRPLKAISSALGRGSRVVERVPGMRRGEDKATRVNGSGTSGWAVAAVFMVVAVSTLMVISRRAKPVYQ